MIDTWFQTLAEQVPIWLATLFTTPVIRQLGAFVIIMLLAPPASRLLQRPLIRLRSRVASLPAAETFPWLIDLFNIARQILMPLVAWLLVRAAVAGFAALEYERSLLDWIAPLLGLWVLFRGLRALVTAGFPPERSGSLVRLLRPIFLILALLQAVGGLDNLLAAGFRLGENLVTTSSVLAGVIVLVLFLILSRNLRQLLGQRILPGIGLEAALVQVLTTFVVYAIIIVGVITAFNVSGIPLTTLTFIAGGLSVGLGFGLQEIISNFVSGFILLFERSIGPGDVIRVGNTMGVVENIGIRSMRIKDMDNVELIVPNSRFLTDMVTNFSSGDRSVRVRIAVGVSYNARPLDVKEALLAAASHPAVMAEPAPAVRFTDFGDSSLNFELLVWTENALSIPGLSSDLRYNIWDALAERHIEIPFPQRDIHIRTMTAVLPTTTGNPEHTEGPASEY